MYAPLPGDASASCGDARGCKIFIFPQITDGYAALILATEDGLRKLGVAKADGVEMAGHAQGTDPATTPGRNVLALADALGAMNKAYAMAGLTPAHLNVAQVHDCFTIMGAIGTEVVGKAVPGQGARCWVDGRANVDGECAINRSGGLIAKGHPVGATGVAMIGWAALQLLGKSPAELQVKAPKAAATFNIVGLICASVCTALKRAGD